MQFTINPQSFNAVMACSAVDDVRYYLNSFFVDVTNNKMVATNGHVLATAPLERIDTSQVDAELETHGLLLGFLFQRFEKPISNKGELVHIDCAKKRVGYVQSRSARKETELETIDDRFPDYPRIQYAGERKAIDQIAFNAEYAAKPARWAGFDYCCAVFDFDGDTNSMGVTYHEEALADVRITLMPARI